jgi:hypothetical protein
MGAPPLSALSADLSLLHLPWLSENDVMSIVTQPPLEIRTRTKNENRTFACRVKVHQKEAWTQNANVVLCYATDHSTIVSTLGGTLTRPVKNGYVNFDDLSVSVASPKHAEKEFVLKITLRDVSVFSTPFYAFSHKTVLKRRKQVSLRALSHTEWNASRQQQPQQQLQQQQTLHVVGAPFVRSDRLQCVFRVRAQDVASYCYIKEESGLDEEQEDWVSFRATNLEVFSETVLFFSLPLELQRVSGSFDAYVQVTNDGRNFSNPMLLRIVSLPPEPATKRLCTIRSRI